MTWSTRLALRTGRRWRGPAPVGYTPANLQAAYNLTDRSGRVDGGTIAIVDP